MRDHRGPQRGLHVVGIQRRALSFLVIIVVLLVDRAGSTPRAYRGEAVMAPGGKSIRSPLRRLVRSAGLLRCSIVALPLVLKNNYQLGISSPSPHLYDPRGRLRCAYWFYRIAVVRAYPAPVCNRGLYAAPCWSCPPELRCLDRSRWAAMLTGVGRSFSSFNSGRCEIKEGIILPCSRLPLAK